MLYNMIRINYKLVISTSKFSVTLDGINVLNLKWFYFIYLVVVLSDSGNIKHISTDKTVSDIYYTTFLKKYILKSNKDLFWPFIKIRTFSFLHSTASGMSISSEMYFHCMDTLNLQPFF